MCAFRLILTHHHLLMVLKLQTEVVPFNEVHVGAHQVKQHLARGFLLRTGGGRQQQKENRGYNDTGLGLRDDVQYPLSIVALLFSAIQSK